MFTIYGKNECPMCFKVKTVLELLGKDYEYKELHKDYTEEEFESEFPDTLSLPQVIMDGKKLGNANETLKYLKEHRLI
jgi:glutaredoxin|tara:strand:- start:307 stop:540 length:234 start_codon:yes stop_codon:yes gene_type:complete